MKKRGGRLFLDLKLHDIPETVARTVAAAARIEADFLTVHTSGGYEMLRRAARGRRRGRPKILGVTVLTSLLEEDLRAEGIELSVAETVRARARVAARAGIAGLVCSPHEIDAAREASRELLLVVPGIRPSRRATARRTATRSASRPPAQAITHGADYIVVGRPIRDAAEPVAAFAALVAEVEAAATAA